KKGCRLRYPRRPRWSAPCSFNLLTAYPDPVQPPKISRSILFAPEYTLTVPFDSLSNTNQGQKSHGWGGLCLVASPYLCVQIRGYSLPRGYSWFPFRYQDVSQVSAPPWSRWP